MKVVVFAYHDIGCTGIEALLESGYEIQAVFTHADDPGENRFFGSVAQLCAEHNLPVYSPEDVNHPLWIERIRELAPQALFSFYYRNMLKQAILDIPTVGAFNLHGSLLPAYRGRAPINWCLVNGESETGITLHQMTAKPDAGAIVAQQAVTIADDDTALTLHGKVRLAARALLEQELPKLRAGDIRLTPQDESKASYYGRRTPADGELHWHRPARELHNLVRAVTQPYPGAFSFAGDRKLTVWKSHWLAQQSDKQPGTILSQEPLRIACGEGVLEIVAGQAEGGLYVRGAQLARELGLVEGMKIGAKASNALRKARLTRVLILGVNGFIGNHLTERLLQDGGYEVYGLDIGSSAVDRFIGHPNFHFVEGDISIHTEWIEYHIKKCDVILPLVDRVIWAYGKKEGLNFTLFRPFNWMGPRLDSLDSARIGSSRAITQLILNLVDGTPIQLVDGGAQKRCFTDIEDGIEALFRIIENKENRCDGQIINIGNPDNEASIQQMAEILLAKFEAHPLRDQFPPFAGFKLVESKSFYGDGYQDVSHRRPSIANARRLLDWEPTIEMEETIGNTLDFFLQGAVTTGVEHD